MMEKVMKWWKHCLVTFSFVLKFSQLACRSTSSCSF